MKISVKVRAFLGSAVVIGALSSVMIFSQNFTSPTIALKKSNPELYEYLLPSVCALGSGKATSDDPAFCPEGTSRRTLRFGEEIPYLRYKTLYGFSKNSSGPSLPLVVKPAKDATTLITMFPVKDGLRREFAAIIQDGKRVGRDESATQDALSSAGLMDLEMTDDYGLNSWDLPGQQTVSSAETNNSSEGPYGWFGVGCRALDSWTLFPRTYIPGTAGGQWEVAGVKQTIYSPGGLGQTPGNGAQDLFLLPPLQEKGTGSSLSLSRNNQVVCDPQDFVKAATRAAPPVVRYYSQPFTFEPGPGNSPGKTLNTVVREYYYSDPEKNFNKADSSNGTVPRIGMELSMYTKEYGHTRWETWKSELVIDKDCEDKAQEQAELCKTKDCSNVELIDPIACKNDVIKMATQIDPASGALRNHCPYSGTPTRQIAGTKAYRVSCSDRSSIIAINEANPFTKINVQPRVYHFSRQLLGANQNWIAIPDFASLAGPAGFAVANAESTFANRWQPSGNVDAWNLKIENTRTRNVRLGVTCKAGTRCSVSTSRIFVGGASGTLNIGPVMTLEEREQLAWLKKLHVGFSIFTSSQFPIPNLAAGSLTEVQVRLLIDGKDIPGGLKSFQVGPDKAQRLEFDVPFTYEQLIESNRFTLVISFPRDSGEVQMDDVFVIPES